MRASAKEEIMRAATELILESGGAAADITTRRIAARAGVGVGLVNYHFQTKENLVTHCVQRIIERVVSGYAPDPMDGADDGARLTEWAARVFEFLFHNEAVSRVSILGDMADYRADSNSVLTGRGFARALGGGISEADKALLTFVLTCAMQVAFLGRGAMPAILGYDMGAPECRRAFVEKLVGLLLDGVNGGKG